MLSTVCYEVDGSKVIWIAL